MFMERTMSSHEDSLTSVYQQDASANDETRLQLSVLDCFPLADLEKVEADPHLRHIRDEAVLWEDVARMKLGKIRDDDSEAQLKVQSAEEAVKQAQEVAAQKYEEMKQALEVVQQKQEELKKCRTIAATNERYGRVEWLAVEDEQWARSAEACETIQEALKTLEKIDEAGQREVDDNSSDVKEEA